MSDKKIDPRSLKLGTEVEVNGIKYASKSLAIQALHDEGLKTGDIARALEIRYQFAYNVIKRTRS